MKKKNTASIDTAESAPTAPRQPAFWQVVAWRVASGEDHVPDDLTVAECQAAVRILTVPALATAAIALFFAIRAVGVILSGH